MKSFISSQVTNYVDRRQDSSFQGLCICMEINGECLHYVFILAIPSYENERQLNAMNIYKILSFNGNMSLHANIACVLDSALNFGEIENVKKGHVRKGSILCVVFMSRI